VVLAAYLSGDVSPADHHLVEQWMQAAPEHTFEIQRLRATWESAYSVVSRIDGGWDAESAWDAFERTCVVTNHHAAHVHQFQPEMKQVYADDRMQRVRTPRLRSDVRAFPKSLGVRAKQFTTAGIGATLVILFAIFGTHTRAAGPAQTSQTYVTRPGQWSTIHLSDHSTITLAPATSVVAKGNEFTLTGEAYFDIVAHSDRPIIVRTRNATVRVLGTRFDVRQYPSERVSRVVVNEGKIALHVPARRNAPVILGQQTVAQVTDSGIVTEVSGATSAYTSWTRGELVFNGMQLRDVVAELGRAYGAEIDIQDSVLARKPMLMEVSVHHESLAEVLDAISLVTGAHYVRRGDAYLVVPGRPTRVGPTRQHPLQPEKHYGR
jgi:ferric-dicitrate binding protein FerR (iron transport regulator)